MSDTKRTAQAEDVKEPTAETGKTEDTVQNPLPRFWPALAGEFTGTFILVFLVVF